MTILEAIQKSTEFLAKKGVDSPRLQSELLLAHLLKMPRLKLYLEFGKNLGEEETSALREMVQRRGAREPLQHILGTACFWGLDINVNRSVLVPRPETEMLAEQGWKFLNGLGRPSVFLDFGTGSGCIAIALCHFAKQASGLAIDRSKEALEVASGNARQHGVSERLRFVESDRFNAVDQQFDLIISNPPYIPTGEIALLDEEVKGFDPTSALDGGTDGLDFYRALATEAGKFLSADGKMMVEFGDGQEKVIPEIFSAAGWKVEQILNDLSERPRMLIAVRG